MPLRLNCLPAPISFNRDSCLLREKAASPLLLSSEDDSDDDESSLPLKRMAQQISDREKQRLECELYMEQVDKELKEIHARSHKRVREKNQRNRRRKSGYEIKKESIDRVILGKENKAVEQRRDDVRLASVQLGHGLYAAATKRKKTSSQEQQASKRRKDPPPPPPVSPIRTADLSLTQDSGSSI